MHRFTLCRWLGHKLDPIAMDHCDYHCVSCGEWCGETDRIRWEWWWSVRHWTYRCWRRVLAWFSRCEDCGRRFGRHNEYVDHIPF